MLTNLDSTNDGILCLCNQVPYERRDKADSDNPFTLKYQILSFVHGKSIDTYILAYGRYIHRYIS